MVKGEIVVHGTGVSINGPAYIKTNAELVDCQLKASPKSLCGRFVWSTSHLWLDSSVAIARRGADRDLDVIHDPFSSSRLDTATLFSTLPFVFDTH